MKLKEEKTFERKKNERKMETNGENCVSVTDKTVGKIFKSHFQFFLYVSQNLLDFVEEKEQEDVKFQYTICYLIKH